MYTYVSYEVPVVDSRPGDPCHPDHHCVFSQERFGCPQCKGMFHAGTSQKIGELKTDASGNQRPVVYGEFALQVATNQTRV